jgi:predicted transcriptional regulators
VENGLIGLKKIRKEKGFSQLKVALDLNMSREALSYYENGKRNPDIQTLKLFSKYFNVSIDFLINGKDFE